MAEVSLPPAVCVSMENIRPKASRSPDVYTTLKAEPASLVGPDPGFMFPPREDGQAGRETTENGAKDDGRTAGRSRPDRISTDPLPPFEFPAPVTPPATQFREQSPTRSVAMPRSGGHHRRRGSEFIGGDGSTAGPGLMSASPTKDSSRLSSPLMGGRGPAHKHRRSAAISNHDLSNILKPTDPNRLMSGSAPTTPSHSGSAFAERPGLDRAASQPTLPRPIDSPTRRIDSPSEAQPPPAVPRSRVVGFSDKLEYIPRPLSTISSATSSSMSTIRPSHSLTGSITSIPSVGASSPPSARKLDHFRGPSLSGVEGLTPSPFDAEPSSKKMLPRPNTPLRDSPSSKDCGPNVILENQPPALVENERDINSNDNRPLAPSVFSQLKNISPTRANFPRIGSPHDLRRFEMPRPRSSPEAKVSKPSKKGKSWTGLLSRRLRQHGGDDLSASLGRNVVSRQAFAPVNDLKYEDVDFDVDNTCVIRNPDYVAPLSAPADKTRMFQHGEDSDDEEPGAVLDISEEWAAQTAAAQNAEAQSRCATGARRPLHSSGATGSFTGPGMHYHRRAESAPVLAPFDNTFGGHRVGGSSQMDDVFEEDESEDHGFFRRNSSIKPAGQKGAVDDWKLTSQARSSQAPKAENQQIPGANGPRGAAYSGLGDVSAADADKTPRAVSPLVSHPLDGHTTAAATSTASHVTGSAAAAVSIENTTTTAKRTINIPEYPDMALDPSPDPAQTSFDVPRLHTARSSITDRSAWSSARTGDSGPQYSTDDIAPSLTSVSSTRTGPGAPPLSPLAAAHKATAARAAGPEEDAKAATRAPSVSEGGGSLPPPPSSPSAASASTPRRGGRPLSSASKRASLASLSRLVGGSFGERSKLSIESRAEDEGGDAGTGEKKKRNRISRLVRFFKSKENLKAAEEGK